jgi:hypothetical protein
LRKELLPSLLRREVAMALDDPALVVPLTKFRKRLPQLLQVLERSHPEQLLIQRADEPFPSGCRTNPGEDSIPRKVISA